VKTAHPLVFEATRRLGDELFRRVQGVGLKYSGGVFVLDVSDPGVDIGELMSFLKSNVAGFTDEDAERVLREWESAEPLRRLRRALSEIAGVKVRELPTGALLSFQLQNAVVRFKLDWFDKAKFKELADRFEYIGNGWFQADLCNYGELLGIAAEILSGGSREKTSGWLEHLRQVCESRIGDVERVKRYLREKHGVEPLSVKLEGEFYVVKFPHLGPEKFKELARQYKYVQGHFLIRRSEIQ
jgi:hypothetical protein